MANTKKEETVQMCVYVTIEQKEFMEEFGISPTKLFRQAINSVRTNKFKYKHTDMGFVIKE